MSVIEQLACLHLATQLFNAGQANVVVRKVERRRLDPKDGELTREVFVTGVQQGPEVGLDLDSTGRNDQR